MIIRLESEISKRSFIFRYYVVYAFVRLILVIPFVPFSPPYQPCIILRFFCAFLQSLDFVASADFGSGYNG